MTTPPPSRAPTKPQLQILRHLADGRTHHKIAELTHLSLKTVDRAVKDAADRLGTRGGAGALAAAYRGRHLTPHPPTGHARPLTPRMRDLLTHIADGLTNDEIAELLGISSFTVKHHTQRLYTALAARNRPQAVARAFQHGHLHPPADHARRPCA